MGNLDKVAIEQETFRDLLRELWADYKSGGTTLEEEKTQGAMQRYGEDRIVNCSVIIKAITNDDDEAKCLRVAVAFLDYLATLGMEVKFKE
jgi:FMN phosphatase YigB (HAD superfamily)